MFCSTRFPLHRLALAGGDSLFLYTDGLTEARNRAGEEFGLARAERLAARNNSADPKALISKYLSELSDFGESAKQTDDLTLLALRRAV
jgi:serine phosphatase RsbU (regulator of sigma subunit)